MTQSKCHIFSKIAVVLIIISISACNNNTTFTKVNDYTQYKLISFTSQSNHLEEGDLAEFKSLYLKNNKDTLIPDSALLNELFNDTITFCLNTQNNLHQIIGKLQEGDSCLALFYKQSNLVKSLSLKSEELGETDTIYAYIKLKHIYKGKEKGAYRLEENAIARYITFSKQHWQASEKGIFYRIIKPSVHEKLVFNDPIKLVYKGYFLNMQVFDNYAEINPFFEHVVGTQNQLITGMEIALKYMSYGSEAEFIFPSSLAFGTKGSSTGIVPAYKPVLFKVKILEKEVL
jgi:FKBP-type peptidyl-prolyl cis-trans isomerase